MLIVKFSLFGHQTKETLDALVESGFVVVRDSFTGNDGRLITVYRICKEEEA